MDRKALDLVDARHPCVEGIWRSLEAYAQPSYFLTWGWIENWLASLPSNEVPSLAVMHRGSEPTAAFFLAQRRVRRNVVQQSNALYFNATGSPRRDGAQIAHNGLLARPGAGRSLAAIIAMLPGDWDELFLPAVDRYAFDDLGASTSGALAAHYGVEIEREVAAPFVDLAAVRSVGYDALLAPSTRSQLQRLRGVLGPVNVELATDTQHAMDIYGELLRLHARSSVSRGMRGAFADPWVERVHRRLILSRFAHGEIQLARLTSKGTTLGCLYNLVSHGRVQFFEAGIAALDDSHLELGYLCHAALVEHNARSGHSTYDLVGGQAAYKESLGTGHNRLLWLKVQRPLARFAIEASLKRWYDLLVGEPGPLALGPA
jgi:CelD/BcsL family acetyltransferase involved in cellulose biosynthesis